MPVDVVIGYTGAVGNAVVRMLVQSSTFRIVGALAHANEKVGRDVGEIAGSHIRLIVWSLNQAATCVHPQNLARDRAGESNHGGSTTYLCAVLSAPTTTGVPNIWWAQAS